MAVRADDQALLATMLAAQDTLGTLAPAVLQFRKVTASYGPGLFHCYDVPDLPPTNNASEQYFGAARYHERRATGRKGAAPGLVVRGAVRLLAAVATRRQPCVDTDRCPVDPTAWRTLRGQLQARQATRCAQRHFRKDPHAYLTALEEALPRPSLPA